MKKKVSIPRTKEECFTILDELLSKEDMEAIAQMEDSNSCCNSMGKEIISNIIICDMLYGVKCYMHVHENYLIPK